MRIGLLSVFIICMLECAYSQNQSYDRIHISLDGGWSYRIAPVTENVTPEVKSYIKGLKSGYNLSGNALVHFNKLIGAGIDLSLSKYQNEENNLDGYTNISGNVTISYIAPCAGFRFIAKEKHIFLLTASIGVLIYKEEQQFDWQHLEMTGTTLGIRAGAGYSYAITKNIAAGAKVSLISGTLYSYDQRINGGRKQKIRPEEDEYEGLSQFTLTGGIRFNF